MLIAEYLQLCGYVSLTGVQAVSVHGFNGESSTENKGAHDLLGSLGEFRGSKELHAGICRSCCLATGLETGLYAREVEIRGGVSRNTKSYSKQKVFILLRLYLPWKLCSYCQHVIEPQLVCLGLTLNAHSCIASKHPWTACLQQIVMMHCMLSCTLGNLTISLL